MQQHKPNAAERLAGRNITWKTLRDGGAHALWLPRMIDVAITNFPGVTILSDLTQSEAFHRDCQTANEIFGYPITFWEPPMAQIALLDNCLAALYISRQLCAVAKLLKLKSKQLVESVPDASALIQSRWITLSANYRSGEIVGDRLITWGFEAYLSRWLTPTVANEFGRALRWEWAKCSLLDEKEVSAPENVEGRDGDLRAALLRGLDELVTTDIFRMAFLWFAYSDEPIAVAASRLGISTHLFHRRFLQPLCQLISGATGRQLNRRVRICPKLRSAFREVLPLSEFNARYRRSPETALNPKLSLAYEKLSTNRSNLNQGL